MTSYARKLLLLAAAVAVTAGLAACGGAGEAGETVNHDAGEAVDGPPDPKSESVEKPTEQGSAMERAGPTIVIRGGEPAEGIAELEYEAGDQIEFTVESDVAEEIHVHGYDISKRVPAGGSVSFSFPAEIEGIFEVEMEARGAQIAELRVNP